MAEAGGSPTTGHNYGAVYHEVSPKWIQAVRISGAVTFVMVVLSFIFTLVKGTGNNSLYLMTCNLIITSFVGLIIAWWYRRGILGADKYWFLLALSGVILFQCLTTDIFVFNIGNAIPPTVAPTTASTPTPNVSISTTTK